MHPLDDTTRFFAVVGAPYIPENHLDDRRDDETRKQSFASAELERDRPPQGTKVTAWWPRIGH